MKKVSVVFVHGLLGDPISSWGNTSGFLEADEELKDQFRLDFFRYPAGLSTWVPWLKNVPWVRSWPIVRRAIKIQDAALGLETHINTVHGEHTPLVLVGHSMGGLVVREYVLNQIIQNTSHRIRQVMLFAVPNRGADLAALGERLSLSSKQIQQLAPNSDYLENLNRRWADHKVEHQVQIGCVAALLDAVVSKESALLSKDIGRAHYLHEDSHGTCIKPQSIDAVSYQLIRASIAKAIHQAQGHLLENHPSLGDPLFYMYDLQCEPYYIERDVDRVVAKLVDTGVWVHGSSGVGKTNCLLRNTLFRNHRVVYVSVANHQGAASAAAVIRSLVTQIVHRATGDGAITAPAEGDPTIWMSDLLRQRTGLTTLTILLDELPHEEHVLLGVTRLVMSVAQAQRMNGNPFMRFALSSLMSPLDIVPITERRVLEVVRPISMTKWENGDIRRLVDRLCHSISVPMSKDNADRIVNTCDGDPRYVKNVFRELNTAGLGNLEQALAAVSAEQIQSTR